MKVRNICDVLDDCYIKIIRHNTKNEGTVLFDDEETTNCSLWEEFAEEDVDFITPVPAKNPKYTKLAIIVF